MENAETKQKTKHSRKKKEPVTENTQEETVTTVTENAQEEVVTTVTENNELNLKVKQMLKKLFNDRL